MRYTNPPADLFQRNRQAFLQQMAPNHMAVFFSPEPYPANADTLVPFSQDSNTYYLTGIDQAGTILVLFPDCPDPRWRETLFVMATNEHLQKWEGKKLSPAQATQQSGVQRILFTDQFELTIRTVLPFAEGVYLDFNEHEYQRTYGTTRAHRWAHRVQEWFPDYPIRRAGPILRQLRTAKSPHELTQIREACRITGLAFDQILQTLRPGTYEFEIEAELTATFLRNRATGHAFHPIVASGANACILHYEHNDQPCRDGDLLLIDFGAEYGNYSADCSRTIPINGRFTPRQRSLYQAVLNNLNHTTQFVRPGVTLKEIETTAGQHMTQQLLQLGLLTPEEAKKENAHQKYLVHGVSHHLGLDTHDFCDRFNPLPAGAVITVEPGIYLHQENTGIRLENTILITEDGTENLTDFPIEPEEIEEKMARTTKS